MGLFLWLVVKSHKKALFSQGYIMAMLGNAFAYTNRCNRSPKISSAS